MPEDFTKRNICSTNLVTGEVEFCCDGLGESCALAVTREAGHEGVDGRLEDQLCRVGRSLYKHVWHAAAPWNQVSAQSGKTKSKPDVFSEQSGKTKSKPDGSNNLKKKSLVKCKTLSLVTFLFLKKSHWSDVKLWVWWRFYKHVLHTVAPRHQISEQSGNTKSKPDGSNSLKKKSLVRYGDVSTNTSDTQLHHVIRSLHSQETQNQSLMDQTVLKKVAGRIWDKSNSIHKKKQVRIVIYLLNKVCISNSQKLFEKKKIKFKENRNKICIINKDILSTKIVKLSSHSSVLIQRWKSFQKVIF